MAGHDGITSPRGEHATQARIDEIKRVWEPGMGATDLSRAVSFECTRNAIIGMFHRHREALRPCYLNARAKGQKKSPHVPRAQPRAEPLPVAKFERDLRRDSNPNGVRAMQERTKQRSDGVVAPYFNPNAREIVMPPVHPEAKLITLEQLGNNTCRWPIGERDFLFCGCHTAGNLYCDYHARVAFRPAPEHLPKARRR